MPALLRCGRVRVRAGGRAKDSGGGALRLRPRACESCTRKGGCCRSRELRPPPCPVSARKAFATLRAARRAPRSAAARGASTLRPHAVRATHRRVRARTSAGRALGLAFEALRARRLREGTRPAHGQTQRVSVGRRGVGGERPRGAGAEGIAFRSFEPTLLSCSFSSSWILRLCMSTACTARAAAVCAAAASSCEACVCEQLIGSSSVGRACMREWSHRPSFCTCCRLCSHLQAEFKFFHSLWAYKIVTCARCHGHCSGCTRVLIRASALAVLWHLQV